MAEAELNPSESAFWSGDHPVVFRDPREVIEAEGLETAGRARGLIFFRTSGSSGRPKFVGHTRGGLMASASAVNRFLSASGADRWLRALPIFHVGGFAIHARGWASGAVVLCDDGKWDAKRFVNRCAIERITLSSLVPTQVHDLVAAGLAAPSSLRAVIVGGAALRPALWERARALGWPLLTSYGLTEAASQVATLRPDDSPPDELTVLDHWSVRSGRNQRLEIRGPALMVGYFNQESDGQWHPEPVGEWFETGDRVELTERDGRTVLRVLGRADRLIKILGEQLDLEVVDAILEAIASERNVPGRVRVCAEPDPRSGHRLLLEFETGVPVGVIRECLDARLPPFARIQAVREVTEIRRSPLGKPVS